MSGGLAEPARAVAAPTVGAALEAAARRLASAGVEGPRRDARLLLAHALGTVPAAVLGYPERTLPAAAARAFQSLVARRAVREPVARILGRRAFWSLELRITPEVLDPRPESETLIEAVLARLADRWAPHRLLDLGTGSGCLLLALLAELPAARGLGVDAAPAAVAVAADNAARLGLAARAEFRVADWGRGLAGPFEAIVANPPYVADAELAALAPEVAHYDPPAALVGGPDGLAACRDLMPEAARLLAPGGLLALEHGPEQGGAVAALARAHGLAPAARLRDLAGRERCLVATAPARSAGGGKKTVGNRGAGG